MGQHARLITDLKLVKELRRSAGREDIPAEDVEKLVALVNDVADVAGPLLERIPATFKQYTEHNILHCRNLLDLMGRFIPRETLRQLNALELTVLILSALLHDFGMFVSEKEKREALKSAEFDSFLAGHHDRATALEEARRNNDHERAEVISDALLAEYFRRLHPERARVNVRHNLAGKLVFRDVDISDYVLDVCESHAWGVHESNDPQHPHKSVNRLSTNKAVYGVSLNLQYAACCLRLADIMDFDRSRTPLVVFQNIDFTEAKSWEEWNKHLSVKGWVVKENDVLFRAECKKPAYYVAVMEFLDWVDYELGECRRLVTKEAPHDIAARYKLHLPPVVDRTQVEMEDKNYLAGAFRFQLEYDRIMKLLMDKSLYPDPSLFLRELLQNSLDACRNREAHAKEAGAQNSYTPRIAVWDYSDDPQDPRIIFQDNGMGMSRRIVENYFMRVGRSYYRSPEFDAERARLKKKGIDLEATSQFGIGILSCFMVADRFEVETYRVGSQPLHITIEGPTKYFTIKLLPEPPRADFQPPPASDHEDGPPRYPGARITVHLRAKSGVDVFQTLYNFAVNVECDIHVHSLAAAELRVIERRRWDSEYLCAKPQTVVTVSEYTLNGLRREMPHVPLDDISDLLVKSRIPFEKYEFAEHLRGDAWFWLLRGEDGAACPQSGYLKITQRGVDLIGAPDAAGRMLHNARVSFKSAEWRALLRALEGAGEAALTPKKLAVVKKVYNDPDNFGEYDADDFRWDWEQLSADERKLVLNSFKAYSEDALPWRRSPAAVTSLYRGDHRWAEMPLSLFENIVPILCQPHAVALHGILLPAGFVKWNPLTVSSEWLKLLAMPGGVQLDIRGRQAPVPTANRLFVDAPEARKVIVPYLRALIRHTLELAANKQDSTAWRDWLNEVYGTALAFRFWRDAVCEEYELLERSLSYAVNIGGRLVYLSRDEVIEKFGRWVPLSQLGVVTDQYVWRDHLHGESATRLLVSFKRLRDEKRMPEVDMESFVVPEDEIMPPFSW
jgi:hypothetical protein